MMNSKFENFQVRDIKPQQGLRKGFSCLLWLSKKVEQMRSSYPPAEKNNVCRKMVAWQRQKSAYKQEDAHKLKQQTLWKGGQQWKFF